LNDYESCGETAQKIFLVAKMFHQILPKHKQGQLALSDKQDSSWLPEEYTLNHI
jgi:hypothetical protein